MAPGAPSLTYPATSTIRFTISSMANGARIPTPMALPRRRRAIPAVASSPGLAGTDRTKGGEDVTSITALAGVPIQGYPTGLSGAHHDCRGPVPHRCHTGEHYQDQRHHPPQRPRAA